MPEFKSCAENARNCEELADGAMKESDRNRYKRMADAWKSLAKTEVWLDGKSRGKNEGKHENQ